VVPCLSSAVKRFLGVCQAEFPTERSENIKESGAKHWVGAVGRGAPPCPHVCSCSCVVGRDGV
jgi:hypothetical protein